MKARSTTPRVSDDSDKLDSNWESRFVEYNTK